ncbi:HAMP domain-containing sensor histidine kinase [Nocardioides sp. W7]|uniref:sensor histidine kinase n=1 Tax=Nocardioides sp. W7 TaxID=2931390 RepID=UPI001FD10240|nr:HAMP domain-containing sensor histidine kinase [Nocardioides sp. W7]
MLPRPRSLTSRLVITAVALVVVVALLVSVATTLALRSYLTGQLDNEVHSTLDRASRAPGPIDRTFDGPPGAIPGGDGDRPNVFGQGVGTLTAWFYADDEPGLGDVITEGSDGIASRQDLSTEALEILDGLPTDGTVHVVDLPALGTYRVAVTDSGPGNEKVAAGLPTRDLDDAVSTLVTTEVALIALGGLLALGAGLVVVRRHLRPLREVAETAHAVASLPLAEGEIDLAERVPEHLTDERTEVGQVGSALNTLLAHVEDSLSARHRSEMQVRQFVADASHELRTPLATIAGYTELARRRPDDAEAGSMALGKVEEESRRMTALVEDLLLLARLDSGRPLVREPVDLTRLLLEAVSDARVLAPGHHWRLDLPQESVEVIGDEQRLHQVVTNLLTNARKHTPDGTTVTVSAQPGGFTVHDDGPGFSPELVDHAFERFARGDASRHREGGAGLGLALVQAIVSAHGGTVTLASTPGDTRVVVRLG